VVSSSPIDDRLSELGVTLPNAPRPIASFVPFCRTGDLVYLAGQTCEVGGKPAMTGRVGIDLDLDAGRAAARLCAINLLAALRDACEGDFERVARCVRVGGFVQAAHGYTGVPFVIDGASELFVALWGERGRHARTSVGVSTLPQNAAVEVEAIFELRRAAVAGAGG
jgi:enamine deaminase RidA (YjgF/YER057c/UK114 family)